jgi:hypothetical protein
MDKETQAIVDALIRINNTLSSSNEVLRRIAMHYDGVVGEMTEQVKRANKYGRMAEAQAEAEKTTDRLGWNRNN